MRNEYLDGIETERLLIRPLTEDDTKAWELFFEDKTPFEFIGLDKAMPAEVHSEGWMSRQFRRYSQKEYGLMAVVEKSSGKLAGQAGIILMNVRSEQELEIGYHMIKEYRGLGYAREAASALIEYIFSNNLASKVIAVINRDNTASLNLAERLGMKYECDTVCMDKPSLIYSITSNLFAG